MAAMSRASTVEMCKGTQVDLWKLMVKPVTREKSFKILLRPRIEPRSPLTRIKVSFA